MHIIGHIGYSRRPPTHDLTEEYDDGTQLYNVLFENRMMESAASTLGSSRSNMEYIIIII